MAIYLIGKIKPKNDGDFAMVDAADIEMPDGTRLDAYLETLELTPGPEGPQGDDGGYYTPSVVDNGDGTFTISFTPSITGMPIPAPVTVTIPEASITVDQALDGQSTNPVANKVVHAAIEFHRTVLELEHEPRLMPEVTTDDNDKILQVVDGKWTVVENTATGGAATAQTVILPETTYEGFAEGQLIVSPAPFVLVEGETYHVVWDGVEHECVCILSDGLLSITDVDNIDAPSEGSFLVQYMSAEAAESDTDILAFIAVDLTSDTMMDTANASHTVAIYQEEVAATQKYVQQYVEQYIGEALGGEY